MTDSTLKNNIEQAINAFSHGNLTDNALTLFQVLGYDTSNRFHFVKHTFEEFSEEFLSEKKIDTDRARAKEWQYIDLLFQYSDKELSQAVSLFDKKPVGGKIIHSYLFFAIQLSSSQYRRSDLTEITRELNKPFAMPVCILFQYGECITLSVADRRLHKKDEQKDVLLKVSQIKDILISNPHRAHKDILSDLALPKLKERHTISNFVDLHHAWLKTLDIQLLNKLFYSKLFNWYLWARKEVRFPNPPGETLSDESVQSVATIRLLTRLIFIWFLKEKKLVREDIFKINELKDLLVKFNPSDDTSLYYNAILQNLFFATLNSPMDADAADKYEKRQFIDDVPTSPHGRSEAYTDQTKYRGGELFEDKQKALQLFKDIPFLNGGLFECLDRREDKTEIRYDGFSSKAQKRACVPNKLFFGSDVKDFSQELEDKKQSNVEVEGIIKILDRYKFTIEENTPLDEDIALDPELLGKVFENLLASFNPETQTTARKQTGSFYTPREIVDYMVEESLKVYLKNYLQAPVSSRNIQQHDSIVNEPQVVYTTTDNSDIEKIATSLFDNTVNADFDEYTKIRLITGLSECHILDPACGSGAFPMGILHKMVQLLRRLDPDNRYWRETQKQKAVKETQKAYEEGNFEERTKRLEYINQVFEDNVNNADYARKLFLIENCIFGVDIQPIAIQISKLRFFISLLAEQNIDDNKPNRGILSMPNLETKFITANTLIGLPTANTLISSTVERIEKELDQIRQEIFFAKKFGDKNKLKGKEKDKRTELKQALYDSGFGEKTAALKADWNPFDTTFTASFFDTTTMFGIDMKEGFDVVIGNPPYGFRTVLTNDEKNYFRKIQKIEFSSGDSAELFVKICFDKLLVDNGILTFIIPKKSLYGDAWEDTRVNYWKKYDLKFILDTGKSFDNVLLEASIFGLVKSNRQSKVELAFLEAGGNIVRFDKVNFDNFFVTSNTCQIYKVLYPISIFNNIQAKSFSERLVEGKLGLAIGTDFFSDDKKEYKLLKGIDIEKYKVRSNRYLDNQHKLNWKNANEFLKPKVISQVIVSHIENPVPHLKITACFDREGLLITNTLMSFALSDKITAKFWLAYLNSKFLSWYAYNFIYSRAIRTMHFYNFYIQQVPIPKISLEEQKPFEILTDYIIYLKDEGGLMENANVMSGYFERIIDAMVYELYFGDEMAEGKCEILKYLEGLTVLTEGAEYVQIKKEYERLHLPHHPIRNALIDMLSCPSIKIIEYK